MLINIFTTNYYEILRGKETEISIEQHGYVKIEEDGKFNDYDYAEEAWKIINWSEYQKEKPDNCYSDICIAGSKVIFEVNDKYYIALSIGFKKMNSIKEVKLFFEKGIKNPSIFFH